MAPLLGKVLVTGGGGFLGSHIVEAFVAEPECAQVVATYRQQRPNQHANPEATYHVCDVSDREQVAALLNHTNPDTIIHTVMPGAFASPDASYRINYLLTKHLLELAKQHPIVRVFIYTSSAEAVGLASGFNSKPENEEEAVLCTLELGSNPYARTKGAADALVLATNAREVPSKSDFRGHLLTTVLRLPGIYGARDKMISERMLSMANTTATRVQLGPNKAMHSWVYANSAATAHVLAAKALVGGKCNNADMAVDGEAFFITDSDPIKFWDFARQWWVAAGDKCWAEENPPRVFTIPLGLLWLSVTLMGWAYKIFTLGTKQPEIIWRSFEYMRKGCWYSNEKAKKRLGYEPLCSTEEGIIRTVEWYKRQESTKSRFKIL